tara:strand:+ start:39 stop:584 length:546 start_codon:yes stop_codon:yes gene_type:complete
MKFKISWHHFLIVILVILLLGCLVNYLEKNNMTEGFVESEKTQLPKKKGKSNPKPKKDSENKGNEEPARGNEEPASAKANNITAGSKKTKTVKEPFTNLSGAPVSSEGPDDCRNPLVPYDKYSCGPVSVDNFFGDIQFKPECCGNPAGSSYSNSMGCACICPEQWTYLNSRGGNRTFPSEF